jgi:hypothetical protein
LLIQTYILVKLRVNKYINPNNIKNIIIYLYNNILAISRIYLKLNNLNLIGNFKTLLIKVNTPICIQSIKENTLTDEKSINFCNILNNNKTGFIIIIKPIR